MEASRDVGKDALRAKEVENEKVRAACVVTAIRLDIQAAKGRWPNDTRVIRAINLVLFQVKQSSSLEELLIDQEALLSRMVADSLNAIGPRLHLLPPEVSAEEIMDLAKRIEPQFVEAVAAIRADPNRFIRAPETVDEWIERSAYQYLQMHEQIRDRENWLRSEFEGIKPVEDGE